jgi:hypothetical protein
LLKKPMAMVGPFSLQEKHLPNMGQSCDVACMAPLHERTLHFLGVKPYLGLMSLLRSRPLRPLRLSDLPCLGLRLR